MFVGPATGSYGWFLADMTGNYRTSVIFCSLPDLSLSAVMAPTTSPKEVKYVVSEEAQRSFTRIGSDLGLEVRPHFPHAQRDK